MPSSLPLDWKLIAAGHGHARDYRGIDDQVRADEMQVAIQELRLQSNGNKACSVWACCFKLLPYRGKPDMYPSPRVVYAYVSPVNKMPSWFSDGRR